MSKLRHVGKSISGSKGLMHWCPGCKEAHVIWVQHSPSGKNAPTWIWNNDEDNPTFSPSIRLFVRDKHGYEITQCHYYLKAGKIEFCNDCDHDFSGKTVNLPDWPDDA